MIRNKLHRGIPFFVALGLMLTPVVSAHAEAYGTGLTRAVAANEEVDPGFMIKPEVFVNGEAISSDEIKILNNTAALPLETISQKMGDILEGNNEDGYMLRKGDKLIKIFPADNKYIVNGVEHSCDFTIEGDKTYAPYSFFNTVMAYEMSTEGNSFIFGVNENLASQDVVLDGTALDNIMISPEVYINGQKFPEFGLEIQGGQVYLPLDVVCEKMGDRLEGDSTTEYYLRKDNMMLVVNYSEGKYYLNRVEHQLNMMMSNGHVYVPVSFLTDVLQYDTEFDGNSTLIGLKAEKTQINDTYPNAKWSNENGNWYYVDGSSKVTGWVAYNNSWYFMNAEGQMQKGWIKDNNNWYFLNENGEMATGWIESNGQHYYLNENGTMAVNTTVDGYQLAENGVCIALY